MMSFVPSPAGARLSVWMAPLRFRTIAIVWAVVIAAATVVLASGRTSTTTSMVVGNVAVAVALLFGAAACFRAARLKTSASRGWGWMSVAMAMGALGQLIFTYAVLNGSSARTDPVSDTIGYLGYSLPIVVALFAFPKPPERLISRFRSLLDAAVITLGVVLVSEATVLHQVRETSNLATVDGLSRLAFPVVDLAICAVVLTLGMRQPPANRLAWLTLGAGLVSLAVTDSVYGALRSTTASTTLTGTPLVAGWMAAPVLVALATLVPTGQTRQGWDLALPVRLVPYLPVLAAIIVVGVRSARQDPFLLVESVLLLLTVAVRQVMIVYENLTLTRDLESKVAARTAELATFGSIVTSSSDAIVGVSLEGVVTAWNPAAEALYGYRRDDVIGRDPGFLSPSASAAVAQLIADARSGRRLSAYEVDWSRPDGTTVPVAMTVSPVLDTSGPHGTPVVQGISIIGQDISERRQIAASLEKAREEALESSRLKSEFLATMSHEIRTPMNGVIGLTSLLIETDLDPTQRKYAEGVQSAGQSLLDVINDILDFSKLEAGKVVIDEDDFDLRRLMEEVGNLLAPAAFSKGLELLISCPPDVPTRVRGDHVRIRQILLNLASNAVKFTSTGEVAVSVEATETGDGQIGLRFEVVDTGIGIAAQDQLRLFESFSQADASTTRRFGGTGLGLAICRRLIEVMGGSIGLQSAVGAGSTFWFELTLPPGLVPDLPDLPPRHDPLPGLRVLVVDDNATNRAILDAQLTSWRMEADLIDNATTALEVLRAAAHREEPYDLAVLDMMMPDVDGLQLAQIITADPVLTGLPMIMLTSALRLPKAVLKEAGIGQWLNKPMSSSELHERLIRLMTPKSTAREQRRPALPAPTRVPTPSRGRVLVVEDNALNQLVAAGLVARLGYEVDTVGHGAEALAATMRTTYDGILMDCHMPVMDGFAATRELRRREGAGRRTPVIALTAGALVSDRERCLAAGMDDYIPKPIEFEALENVLARWLPPTGEDRPIQAGPTTAPEAAVLDSSRLEVLRSLRAPDGSSLLATFISTFTARSAERLVALRAAVDSGDFAGLSLAAHELKGSASTIGAVRVADLSGTLERSGRDATPVSVDQLDQLDAELSSAAEALSGMVAVTSR